MSWRDYFLDHPEHEELFHAIRDRAKAEITGETFDYWEERKKRDERGRIEEADDHYCKYLRNEHYREQWAKKKNYQFIPKAYDPKAKYR